MSRHDLFSALPKFIAAKLGAIAPQLKECAVHPTRLTIEELANERVATPSIRVVLLGGNPKGAVGGPVWEFELAFIAYVITGNARGVDADAACKVLAQAVLNRVAGTNWGDRNVGEAHKAQMQALDTSITRKKGIGLRAVTWFQPVHLSRFQPKEGVVPARLYVGDELISDQGGEP